jgi:hypothetical protein
MSDKLDASAAKALDKITDSADAIVAKLGTLADKYGPEVLDAALMVIRLKGVGSVATGLFSAVLTFFALRYGLRLAAEGKRISNIWWMPETPASAPDGTWQIVFGVVLCCAACAGALISFVCLTDLWTYVAIIEPKLWVAKRLLGL